MPGGYSLIWAVLLSVMCRSKGYGFLAGSNSDRYRF